MKKSTAHIIFLIASLIAIGFASVLLYITLTQTLTGNQTFFSPAQVVYDQTDTQAIAQVKNAAGIQLAFLVVSEVSLLMAGITGLFFANRKTSKTLLAPILTLVSLGAWIIEGFAWSNLDKLMNQYDIYSSSAQALIISGIVILVGVLIAYTIGIRLHQKEQKISSYH